MFDFNNLFVLDLANNHQGDMGHAKNIINELGDVLYKKKVKAGIKFQFRNLKNFIHPDKKNDKSNKNIDRFLSTELNWEELLELKNLTKENNLLAICTPFDEYSVDKIIEMNFDIIKVASCSADDWPLLEKIVSSGLPIIVSTGGLNLNEIDNLVSFFKHKGSYFSIMHCISIYPMENKDAHIGFIKKLCARYPDIVIGWSTHERPSNADIIKLAYVSGARIYERHVGKSSERYKLNEYSSNPEQVENWINNLQIAKDIYGNENKIIKETELKSLNKLKRGIFLSVKKNKGEVIKSNEVFFAIPFEDKQMHSGMWQEGMITKDSIKKGQALKVENISKKNSSKSNEIKKIIHKVKGMLNEAKIYLNPEFEVEFSHHFGVKEFNEIGAVIINCINREYCKKILVQLPGQSHPSHFHKKKEETFHLLSGDLTIFLEGIERKLSPGETCLVMPGMWHSFSTIKGCIFEEISTTHYKNDSVYKNPKINKMKLEERKTIVKNWGRFFIN